MARRGPRRPRQQRNIDEAAATRRREFVYMRCWACGREFVVNNYSDLKIRRDHLKAGPYYLCYSCKTGSGRDLVRLFVLALKTSAMGCIREPFNDPACKCVPCTADRVVCKMTEERPFLPQKMYRKKARVELDD